MDSARKAALQRLVDLVRLELPRSLAILLVKK
jgi:hypothetical protein